MIRLEHLMGATARTECAWLAQHFSCLCGAEKRGRKAAHDNMAGLGAPLLGLKVRQV